MSPSVRASGRVRPANALRFEFTSLQLRYWRYIYPPTATRQLSSPKLLIDAFLIGFHAMDPDPLMDKLCCALREHEKLPRHFAG